MNDDGADPGMNKDEITLPDGRYLIYYTFDDEGESRPAQTPLATPS